MGRKEGRKDGGGFVVTLNWSSSFGVGNEPSFCKNPESSFCFDSFVLWRSFGGAPTTAGCLYLYYIISGVCSVRFF